MQHVAEESSPQMNYLLERNFMTPRLHIILCFAANEYIIETGLAEEKFKIIVEGLEFWKLSS